MINLTVSKVPHVLVLAFTLLIMGCGEKQAISGRIPTTVFKTFSGESFTLSAEDKEVTLLVFWATWCQPCLMEIPALVQLHEKYQSRKFRVVSVNVDDSEGQKVRAIIREYGINYPTLIGTEDIMKQFGGIVALPTSFLIGRDGRIVEKLQGLKREEEMERMVVQALGASG